MLRLRTAKLHRGETLTSLCSRVAAANGRSMDEFCRDMGLNPQEVINGNAAAIEEVSKLARAPVSELARSATVRLGNSLVFNGETFAPRYFNRTNFRFCPKCLEEDMDDASAPPKLRRYGRTIWSSRFIRTCLAHQWSITDAGHAPNTRLNHDFCMLLDKLRPEIRAASDRSRAQVPTAFEQFVVDRFSGVRAHGDFLDSLGLQAAADLCELTGMGLQQGKDYRSLGRSDSEWQEAGQLGYSFLCRGVTGWRELLQYHCDGVDRAKALLGGNAIYGQLHRFLSNRRHGADYDRIRSDMRAFAVERLSLTSETVIFGEKVATARLTPNQVKARYGHDSRFVRKLLLANGGPGSTKDGKAGTTFDDDAVAVAAHKLKDAVKGLEAGRLLGVGKATQKILVEEGYLKPMIERNRSVKLGRLFSRTAILAFVQDLFPKEPCIDVDGMYPFELATRRAHASQREIFKLLLQRKLVRVGVDERVHGIGGLLLDPSEITRHTRLPDHDCLVVDEVRIAMGTSRHVVKALIEGGHLAARLERNPVTRVPQQVVHPSDLERFRSEFISFHDIKAEQAITWPALRALLKAHSVLPAFPADVIRVSFYKRSEIAKLFSEQ